MKLRTGIPAKKEPDLSTRAYPGTLRGVMSISLSPSGKATEKDARLFAGTVELWRSIPKPKPRRTPLGRRLDEIRERIKASGQPLLSSWEELDRELADRRGEPLEEPDR